MPDFPKPDFPYAYDVDTELKRIRQHQAHRQIPSKQRGRLLLATWNIANLGTQQRRNSDLGLIAEIIRPFGLIAIQEVRDNYRDLKTIMGYLGNQFTAIFTDAAGNDERLAFIYDTSRVQHRELIGELVVRKKTLA